jgi:hypothetical protein
LDIAEKLMAIEEIKVLKARYFRYLDTKQWSAWEELFEPDILFDFPDDKPEFSMPIQGRAKFVEAARKLNLQATSIHHGHCPEIEIITPTTARGIWAMEDTILWSDDADVQFSFRKLRGWGHYHETYIKGNAGWRIASMKVVRLLTKHI